MLVGAPQDLIVVRVRDVDDRIDWEVDHGNYCKAVEIAMKNRHVLKRHVVSSSS